MNHVVPHDELLPAARRLAADVTSTDRRALRTLLETYAEGALTTAGDALDLERRAGIAWQRAMVDPAELERRRRSVTRRDGEQS